MVWRAVALRLRTAAVREARPASSSPRASDRSCTVRWYGRRPWPRSSAPNVAACSTTIALPTCARRRRFGAMASSRTGEYSTCFLRCTERQLFEQRRGTMQYLWPERSCVWEHDADRTGADGVTEPITTEGKEISASCDGASGPLPASTRLA